MNRLILFFLLFIFYSCQSENNASEESNTSKNDSIPKDSISDVIIEEENYTKLLPHQTGTWIEVNLNNKEFRSKKVDDLVALKKNVKKMPTHEAVADWTFDILKEQELRKLTVRELLYYSLAYPASYSQICAEGTSDTTTFPKIRGRLPFGWWGEEMSELQWSLLEEKRDSVIFILTGYINRNPDKISVHYLEILRDLNAVEAFPAVIETANENNLNNYAFLLEFMNDKKYEGLHTLPFYEYLFGDQWGVYEGKAPATSENRNKVIKLAKKFYEENYN